MLADLIQRHANNKHKHKASLPLNKLMRAAARTSHQQYRARLNQADPNSYRIQNGQMFAGASETNS